MSTLPPPGKISADAHAVHFLSTILYIFNKSFRDQEKMIIRKSLFQFQKVLLNNLL